MSDFSKLTDEEILSILSSAGAEELKKRGYEYGWHKKRPFVGVIYILINPAFPNLVKIGYAADIQDRLKQFNRNTGLPAPYHCYAIYKVTRELGDKKLFELIDKLNPELRYSPNREHYEISPQDAFDILSAIAQINGEEEQLILNPLDDPYFDQPSVDTKKPQRSEKKSIGQGRYKQEKLRFSMLEIPVGSVLVYTKDDTITCKTIDESNKVEYNGKTYTISGLAKELLGYSAQGGQYFLYNGELLTDRRARLGV